MKNYMVFDIGGTSVKWSVINEEGNFIESGTILIADEVEEFFNRLINTTNKMKEKHEVEGIAISSPGAVDSESGIVGGASAIFYIHGPNFKTILNKATNLRVEIENDANCAALGEGWLGAAKYNNDVAFVVCGSGIGGALIKDKKIHKGINKHGGEFGYCLVNFDINAADMFKSWSMLGSTSALVRTVAKEKGVAETELDGIKILELAALGDEIAIKEVDKYFYYMAIGIYNIQYNYDPELIVLGGGISESDGYVDEINKRIDMIMKQRTDGKIRPQIKRCEKGNDANKLGALYHYLHNNL